MNQKTNNHSKRRPLIVLLLTGLLIISMAFVAVTFYQLIRNAKHEQEWVSLATDVQVSSQRLAKSASEAASGNLDAFSELSATFQRMTSAMNSLRNGSSDQTLPALPKDVSTQLSQLNLSWGKMSEDTTNILDSSSDLLKVRGAADEIFLDSRTVFDQAALLSDSIADLPSSRIWPSMQSAGAGLVIMVGLVAMLVSLVISAERKRATVATSSNRQNQRAIMTLLDELGSLADGDLTVHATVSNQVTGAIADAVNYAVERLRELVMGINLTANSVAKSAQLTRTSTSELAEAAGRQATEMDSATESIKQMAGSFDQMADRSKESSQAANRSVEIAHSGAEKVRETISGMDNIREQIQETSKRIKRLGESTQEIGDIVSLIDGIAEQTNVLALNAAIQAASAGGAGKGFAVVADEVQQLAESATQATRRIETLVQTIQADTSEAVASMESTTSEVVSGTRLAEDAGTALAQIETESNQLSSLIEGIAEEANDHSAEATKISEIIHSIRDISIQNSEGSKQTAGAVDNLAKLVMQLRESVADFKLPEAD
jgi:twitching motility protein PilJ